MGQIIEIGKNSESDILIINENISNALNILVERTLSTPENAIIDRKTGGGASQGVLQDCEFGMILLLGVEWLEANEGLSGILTNLKVIKELIVKLVIRTIKRVIKGDPKFDKKGGDHEIIFFSGMPYSYIYDNERKREHYSSNVDAVMITISFLATALEKYDNELKIDHKIEKDELPKNLKTIRDISLYVIQAGLEYASKCIVKLKDEEFSGFTAEPSSVSLKEDDSDFVKDTDRLFYTWTNCETIADLVNWNEYLTKIQRDTPIVKEIKKLLSKLEITKDQAAIWAYNEFFKDFEFLKKNINVKEIVNDINPREEDDLDEKQFDDIEHLTEYIQKVYHISQYAAIRSLYTGTDDILDEVKIISKNLSDFTFDEILNSGLDASNQENLYKTLTRRYKLGKAAPNAYYTDDAYYPLVVRSISGLFTRTIDLLAKKKGRENELKELISDLREDLGIHVSNMLSRRPDDKEMEDGDEKLWSYAKGDDNEKGKGKEYVLYATQRTMFALISYGKFLKKMDAYEAARVVSWEEAQKKLQEKLAKSIARNLLGPEIINELVEFSSTVVTKKPSAMPQEIPLPKSEWARDVLIDWLTNFTKELDEQKVYNKLEELSNKLIGFFTFLKGKDYKIPHNLSNNKQFQDSKKTIEKIKESIYALCPELKKLEGDWEIDKIVPLLFKNIFKEFINNQEETLATFMKNNTATFPKEIMNGFNAKESFRRLKETLEASENNDTK